MMFPHTWGRNPVSNRNHKSYSFNKCFAIELLLSMTAIRRCHCKITIVAIFPSLSLTVDAVKWFIGFYIISEPAKATRNKKCS